MELHNHRLNARSNPRRALGAAIALTAAACGSDEADEAAEDPATTEAMEEDTATTEAMEEDTATTEAMEEDTATTEAMEEDTATTEAMEEDTATTEAMEEGGEAMEEGAALGPLCEAVPADGPGSFAGMTEEPAATAASNNPALSTLVAAVDAAGLVDTLNSDGPFTIFAPANPAFEAFSQEELDALLADTETLTSVLTLHVVPEQLSSADLAEMDSVPTVNGEDITIAPEGDTLSINGQAMVGCADVQTANATVHIIDAVLMPGGGEAMEDGEAMEEDGDAMEEDGDAMEEDGEEGTEEDG